VQFAVLGYAITSMETETYRPARLILLGEGASPELRRSTSLDALVTPGSPPFFIWHTAEDPYVPPEHAYRSQGAGQQRSDPSCGLIDEHFLRLAIPRQAPRNVRRTTIFIHAARPGRLDETAPNGGDARVPRGCGG
jgi:hypothetical protein